MYQIRQAIGCAQISLISNSDNSPHLCGGKLLERCQSMSKLVMDDGGNTRDCVSNRTESYRIPVHLPRERETAPYLWSRTQSSTSAPLPAMHES